MKFSDDRKPEIMKEIEYNSQQLQDGLLPAYREMLRLYREKSWLAESGATEHFTAMVEFIDIWDRFLAKAIPRDVLQKLDHREETLEPLYQHVETTHELLRSKLAKGKV